MLDPAPLPRDGGSAGVPLRLFDTAARGVVRTTPGHIARLYVCGITPYDATHMGHAATYVAFDLVNRVWRDLGHTVNYVQNVTDVDDPLLERAVATGQDWRSLAAEQTRLFAADMAALNVLPPTDYVGVVEAITLVVEWIERLSAKGATYRVGADIYFDTKAATGFGTISGLTELEMLGLFAHRGGDPDRPGKRAPLDPLLWMAARPDEPAWDTTLGHGRPGWHIECTAIALHYLGPNFDVQGGGSDLVFPHHEMCAAQAQVVAGGFARNFVHAGMVAYEGAKMSKSLGNLVFVSHLRAEGVDPAIIRLALLNNHYRSDWEWQHGDLIAAQRRFSRWRQALTFGGSRSEDAALMWGIRERLVDDLDAPGALVGVDRWADSVLARSGARSDLDTSDLAARVLDTLLGVVVS